MPCRLSDVVPDELVLGPVIAAGSGASAMFEGKHVVQTPWMMLIRKNCWDDGKVTLYVEPDDETREWVTAIEACLLADLQKSHPDIRDFWRPCIDDEEWKINIPKSCHKFGDELVNKEVVVAIILEVQGAWMWNKCAGMKTKAIQLKADNQRNGK